MNLAFPFLFQFLFFAAVAVFNPFLALYYQSIGQSGAEIGLLTGIMPLVAMIGGPVWGAVADVTQRYRLIMSISILGTILFGLLIPSTQALAILLGIVFLFAFISAPLQAFGDSATLAMLGERRDLYGRVRLGGTIGFGVLTIPAGILIGKWGLASMFPMYAVFMALLLVVAQFLTFSRVDRSASFRAGLGSMLGSKAWLVFLGMVLTGGIGMGVINTYFLVYMEEAGIPRASMGFALALATAAEIPAMLGANWLLRRFKSSGLMVIGLSVIALRLIVYFLFPTPLVIFGIQIVHGLTFAAIWLAGINYVAENAPPGMQATSQAIFGGVMMNLGGAIGNFIGGMLLEKLTAAKMYGIIGGAVAAGMIFFLLIGGVKSSKVRVTAEKQSKLEV